MPPRLPPRSTTSRSATGEDGGTAVFGRDERLGQEGEVDKDAEAHFCASSQHCLHGENVHLTTKKSSRDPGEGQACDRK